MELLSNLTTTSAVAGTIQLLNYLDYDEVGLVGQVTSPLGNQSWQYAYDGADRLTEATTPGETQTFQYDLGNRMEQNSRAGGYTYGAGQHRPASINGVSLTWDGNGNLLSDGTRSFVWHPDNRPASVTSGGVTTQFAYDESGERVMKQSGGSVSYYPFGDDYEVRDGVTTKYLTIPGLGLVAKRVTGGAEAGTYWVHTDRLGSVQALTDATGGQALAQRGYRPYGELLGGSSSGESRGWIDQRTDDETGLTYLHARYYDPRLGIFISADPIGIEGGTNLYGYGSGDPANRTDRSGLKPATFPSEVSVCGLGKVGTPPNCHYSYGYAWFQRVLSQFFSSAADEVDHRATEIAERLAARQERREQRRSKECEPGDPGCTPKCKPGEPGCVCTPGEPGCKAPLPEDIARAQGAHMVRQATAYLENLLKPKVCGWGAFGVTEHPNPASEERLKGGHFR